MLTVYAIHAPNQKKLAAVLDEMKKAGAPIIKVVDCGDHYMALEGSHRLAAAARLNMTPEFIVYGNNDLISIDEFDWYDTANWAGITYLAGEVASELYSTQAVQYFSNEKMNLSKLVIADPRAALRFAEPISKQVPLSQPFNARTKMKIDLNQLMSQQDSDLIITAVQTLHNQRITTWQVRNEIAAKQNQLPPHDFDFGIQETKDMLNRLGAGPMPR
jgi:hypothetical protein